jgi:hypothetical protein
LGRSVEGTRTAVFLYVAAGQLLLAYPARWSGFTQPRNVVLHGAVAVTLLLQPLLLLVPGLRVAFDTVPIDLTMLACLGGAALTVWLLAAMTARRLWRSPA